MLGFLLGGVGFSGAGKWTYPDWETGNYTAGYDPYKVIENPEYTATVQYYPPPCTHTHTHTHQHTHTHTHTHARTHAASHLPYHSHRSVQSHPHPLIVKVFV